MHPAARRQDVEIIGNGQPQLLGFVIDFVAAQRGQALQAQVQDRLGLFLGQT